MSAWCFDLLADVERLEKVLDNLLIHEINEKATRPVLAQLYITLAAEVCDLLERYPLSGNNKAWVLGCISQSHLRYLYN